MALAPTHRLNLLRLRPLRHRKPPAISPARRDRLHPSPPRPSPRTMGYQGHRRRRLRDLCPRRHAASRSTTIASWRANAPALASRAPRSGLPPPSGPRRPSPPTPQPTRPPLPRRRRSRRPRRNVRAWHKRFLDLNVRANTSNTPASAHNSWTTLTKTRDDWFAKFRRVLILLERVRFVSRAYRYPSAYWVRFDSLTPGGVLALIDAALRRKRLEIETKDLRLHPRSPATHSFFSRAAPRRYRGRRSAAGQVSRRGLLSENRARPTAAGSPRASRLPPATSTSTAPPTAPAPKSTAAAAKSPRARPSGPPRARAAGQLRRPRR